MADLLSPRSERHDCGKISRPVAELLVQAHVFGVREQPGVPYAPSLEDRHCGCKQPLCHAAVPVFRQHSQGSEEPERSPARDYVGSDQAAIFTRRDHLHVCRAPAWCHEVAVAHEVKRIGHPQERSKCEPNNTVCLFKFALFQWTNFDELTRRHRFMSPAPARDPVRLINPGMSREASLTDRERIAPAINTKEAAWDRHHAPSSPQQKTSPQLQLGTCLGVARRFEAGPSRCCGGIFGLLLPLHGCK